MWRPFPSPSLCNIGTMKTISTYGGKQHVRYPKIDTTNLKPLQRIGGKCKSDLSQPVVHQQLMQHTGNSTATSNTSFQAHALRAMLVRYQPFSAPVRRKSHTILVGLIELFGGRVRRGSGVLVDVKKLSERAERPEEARFPDKRMPLLPLVKVLWKTVIPRNFSNHKYGTVDDEVGENTAEGDLVIRELSRERGGEGREGGKTTYAIRP